jgi:transcriptional regulator with XRE-family HTH domain
MDVPTLIGELGASPSATARTTGLSRATVRRVRDGVSSPTMDTLRELALAAGYDLDIALVPASDPAAAVAARVLVDPATPAVDVLEAQGLALPGEAAAVAGWMGRLERHDVGEPDRLLEVAGRFSAPQHRRNARYFAPKSGVPQERIIDIAGGALGDRPGALSGVAAALLYLGHAPDPGPVVAWTVDVEGVAERMGATLREVGEYQPAGVLLAPTMSAYLIDMVRPPDWPQRVVSPIQAALDLHGLGHRELAHEITEGW